MRLRSWNASSPVKWNAGLPGWMRRELLLLEEIVVASSRAFDIASRHTTEELTRALMPATRFCEA